MLLSENISLTTTVNNFADLNYEVIHQQNLPSNKFQCEIVKKTVTNNIDSNPFGSSNLQLNYKGKEPITINFTNRLFYTQSINDTFKSGIPFYLNLTQLHKTVVSTESKSTSGVSSSNSLGYISSTTISSKYSYIEICLEMYNSVDEKLDQAFVTPNTNILFDAEFFSQKKINCSEISYFKLSIVIKEPCKINLNYFMFGFSDFMSTDTFYSKKFDVTVRLQVNNLKKKKNGIVIFFPSFYIKERDSESISHGYNSVKWPNFTRHTWGNDLDNVCTIFVSDPFQYVNGNSRSSWFFAPNGQSILSEIASYIKKILSIQNENLSKNNSNISNFKFFVKYGFNKTCGPIITYGSSMGGFAAFLFSCYLEPTLCFCECPQTNLIKYKYSKEYLETCEGLGLKDISSSLSSCPINEKNKKKEQLISDIVKKHDLSFSAILRNHEPKFRSLIHFYSIDKLHLTSFDNEICSLTEEERKKFNYQLVIENDIENQLFAHQAMPKEKVLEIFKHYLSMTK